MNGIVPNPAKFTSYAMTYVAACQREGQVFPSWSDVLTAYDEGLKHGVNVPNVDRRKLSRLFLEMRASRSEP